MLVEMTIQDLVVRCFKKEFQDDACWNAPDKNNSFSTTNNQILCKMDDTEFILMEMFIICTKSKDKLKITKTNFHKYLTHNRVCLCGL